MTELGRIVARLGSTYGWTPRQILSELSLEQMVCLHRYALEMEGLIPREIEEGSHSDGDHNKIALCDERGELDTEQLERMFGPPTVLEDGSRRWGK